MGENSNLTDLLAACPNRDYNGCFSRAMRARYPSPELFHVGRPPAPADMGAADYARRLFPGCESSRAPQPHEEGGLAESFTSSALDVPASQRIHAAAPTAADLRRKLREASARALAGLPTGTLRCGSPIQALDSRLLLMIGLPTTARDPRRRGAARTSWMAHPAYGQSVCACFLLSAHAAEHDTTALISEHATHADLLMVDAPETSWLISKPTKYSNFTRAGRGMPTFKQYAFFQHAARSLPHVPYIGKIDDDTAPNLGPIVNLLAALRCR